MDVLFEHGGPVAVLSIIKKKRRRKEDPIASNIALLSSLCLSASFTSPHLPPSLFLPFSLPQTNEKFKSVECCSKDSWQQDPFFTSRTRPAVRSHDTIRRRFRYRDSLSRRCTGFFQKSTISQILFAPIALLPLSPP